MEPLPLFNKIDYLAAMSIEQRTALAENPMKGDCDTPPDSPQKDQENAPVNSPQHAVEPTRFGDWERAGRCIDF